MADGASMELVEQHSESETRAHARTKELEAKVRDLEAKQQQIICANQKLDLAAEVREIEAKQQQLICDNLKLEHDGDAVKFQNVSAETQQEAEKASVEVAWEGRDEPGCLLAAVSPILRSAPGESSAPHARTASVLSDRVFDRSSSHLSFIEPNHLFTGQKHPYTW